MSVRPHPQNKLKPTLTLYPALVEAYDFFNSKLFSDQLLPDVMFTLARQKRVLGYFSAKRWVDDAGNHCGEIGVNPTYMVNVALIEIFQTLVHEMCHCWQVEHGKPSRRTYHNLEWAKRMIKVGLMPSSTGEIGGAVTGQLMSDYVIAGGDFYLAFKEFINKTQFKWVWVDKYAFPARLKPTIADPKVVQASMATIKGSSIHTLGGDAGESLSEIVAPEENEVNSLLNIRVSKPEGVDVPPAPTRARYTCACDKPAIVYGKPGLDIGCNVCNANFIET